ncbi:MAG TPA: bile acid:sodium symporter [Puia sp.]|uniref:bile acid:sodium symporter n=1 Tax=Puia sp. TaxID=2045100 RepID=UPI002BC166D2|nr:bile acid:sodium symporter [Puia sp.]HVU96946.1 bile acid:sodium symporter [Puia sp.]
MKRKDLTYTFVIIIAVIISLCFPKYFTEIGGYKLAGLITPLLQIIMFGMGTSMSVHDFAGVIKQPKGVIIGVCSHYIIMPLLGYTLASISGLPPEVAAGIILVGCSPNGLASNVISYLAQANLALSVTLTAISTLLSPLLTPRLMGLLAGQMIHVDVAAMTWDIMKMVIIPIGAGLVFNHFLHGKAKWLDKAMPKVSMAAIALIITIITAAGRSSLLTIGPLLILIVLTHNLLGYCLGYWSGRVFRLSERDCRTMAIEVGMQNAGLASGLAKGLGKIATVGLAPAIFGPLMNTTGSLLASYWHRKPPEDRERRGGGAVTGAVAVVAGLVLLVGCGRAAHSYDGSVGVNWPAYGGNKAGNRYSPLDQINAQNVSRLAVAWTYDAAEDADSNDRGHEIQCQPIVVDGVLYGTGPALGLFAVNAGNGKPIWKFSAPYERMRFNTNRGVLYWEQGSDKRILYSAGSNLYAIDAATGKLVNSFGKNGIVDLHEGLGEGLGHPVDNLMVTATTPGVIYKNILVVGSSVSEGGDAAPGDVRGFDIPTGRLKWVFHTIPRPGEEGYETWPPDAYRKIGGANCWGGLVVDERRGLVFFGTGSPSVDFYGGARAGENLFANCIVAVHAETGRLAWYYQTVHHDLWDRDIPCPPNLVTVRHNGKSVDALVQTTKDGQVYVLDRDSGKSLFAVEERAVPVDGLPGEHPWPTQRYPLKPAPLSRQTLADSDLTTLTPEAHAFVEKRFREIKRPYNKFLPPDTTGTLLLGYSGGAEWGGNATDPNGILYQNANEGFWDLQLFSLADWEKALANVSRGNALYMTNCSACHGRDRRGVPNQFPDLTRTKRGMEDIQRLIATGSGKMPSFPTLSAGDRKAIADYLLRPWAMPEKNEHAPSEEAKASSEAYVIKVWKNFTDADGYPATRPPWGTLNAIDLNTGDYLWRVPLGEYPELVKKGIPATGSESYGGPLVTAGGLLFIAGTRDGKFRAFDPKTGKVLWEYQFPAGAYSTPITYSVDGKQYIAIADGGGRGGPFGGKYYAFALQ